MMSCLRDGSERGERDGGDLLDLGYVNGDLGSRNGCALRRFGGGRSVIEGRLVSMC